MSSNARSRSMRSISFLSWAGFSGAVSSRPGSSARISTRSPSMPRSSGTSGRGRLVSAQYRLGQPGCSSISSSGPSAMNAMAMPTRSPMSVGCSPMWRDMASIVLAVVIASSNRPWAISSRNRACRPAASDRIFCRSGRSRLMPSVLSRSRICQSGLSIRAARSACRSAAGVSVSCSAEKSWSSSPLR